MRHALAVALLGCSALAAPAWAQMQPTVTPDAVPQGQAAAKAAISQCGQLVSLILGDRQAAGITLEQARAWQQRQDVDNCNRAAQRILETQPRPAR